jgi:hypothetical protein
MISGECGGQEVGPLPDMLLDFFLRGYVKDYIYRTSMDVIETLLDHMDWEGEIREFKCSLTSVKEMSLL